VYQAYEGASVAAGAQPANAAFQGYLGETGPIDIGVPGVLQIIPGPSWANFVGAAQVGVPYTIKNVMFTKVTPRVNQCADVFPAHTIIQQGTPNIRLNWPLMYEVPSTVYTLTILYGTGTPYQDLPSNPPGYVHTEVWSWHVNANLDSLEELLELFHVLPFGLDEVPLISNESLYPVLQAKIAAVAANVALGTPDSRALAGFILGDFEMEVMDACIGTSPASPVPSGGGTGISNSAENPACCKLLVDAEYIGNALGIFVQNK